MFGQADWISASFFSFACLWTPTSSRSMDKHAKKELGQYPAMLTEQAWSITHKTYTCPSKFVFRHLALLKK